MSNVPTFKTRRIRRVSLRDDVPLNRLKRELEAGIAHFWNRRQHLAGRGDVPEWHFEKRGQA